VGGKRADVWVRASVLEGEQLGQKAAAQAYRWRWRNEGLFCTYKRRLAKAKLQSRTVRLAHREAETSMLALALLMAAAAQAVRRGAATVRMPCRPRRVLLSVRRALP